MAHPSSGSLVDTSVKLILIFLISLLSFAVGTFVGKGVSEAEHRRVLLEMNEYKRFQGQVADNNEAFTVPKGLSKEEVDHLTQEFIQAEKRKLDSKSQSSVSNDNKKWKGGTLSKNHTSHRKQVENTLALNKAIGKNARQPTSNSKAASAQYNLQIASYVSKDKAKEHTEKLKTKGHQAFYTPAIVKGSQWYRVHVGPFSNIKKAKYYRNQLRISGEVDAALIRKISLKAASPHAIHSKAQGKPVQPEVTPIKTSPKNSKKDPNLEKPNRQTSSKEEKK